MQVTNPRARQPRAELQKMAPKGLKRLSTGLMLRARSGDVVRGRLDIGVTTARPQAGAVCRSLARRSASRMISTIR